MNIVQLQNDLKGMPDNVIIGYVQNPNGQVPSYLALGELQRRKAMRDEHAARAQAPTKSVAEELTDPPAPTPQMGGIAGLPMQAEPMSPKGMAAGGIVAFDEGGLASDDNPEWLQKINTGRKAQGLPPVTLTDMGMAPAPKTWAKGPTSFGPSYLNGVRQPLGWVPPDTQSAIPNVVTAAKPPDSPEAVGDALAKKMHAQGASEEDILAALRKLPNTTVNIGVNDKPPTKDGVAGLLQGSASNSVSSTGANRDDLIRPVDVQAPTIPDRSASYNALLQPTKTGADIRNELDAYMGSNTGLDDIKARLADMEKDSKEEERQAPWMSLARAGFAIAGGKSPYALQNVGEGAQVGLTDYAAAKERLGKDADKQMALRNQIAQSERAEKFAAYKFGEDSAERLQATNNTVRLKQLEAQSHTDVEQAKMTSEASKTNEQANANWNTVQGAMANAERSLATAKNAANTQNAMLLRATLTDLEAKLKDPNTMLTSADRNRFVRESDELRQQLYNMVGVKMNVSSAGPDYTGFKVINRKD